MLEPVGREVPGGLAAVGQRAALLESDEAEEDSSSRAAAAAVARVDPPGRGVVEVQEVDRTLHRAVCPAGRLLERPRRG